MTVNAKGLITGITALVAGDIPSLTHTKISDFDTGVQTNRIDQLANPTGSLDLNSQKITNLADPTSAQDAVTKSYADALTSGLDVKEKLQKLRRLPTSRCLERRRLMVLQFLQMSVFW